MSRTAHCMQLMRWGCASRFLLPSLISPSFRFSRLFVIHGELTQSRTALPVLPYGLTTSVVGEMEEVSIRKLW